MLETLRNSLVFHAFINEQRGCCVLNEQTTVVLPWRKKERWTDVNRPTHDESHQPAIVLKTWTELEIKLVSCLLLFYILCIIIIISNSIAIVIVIVIVISVGVTLSKKIYFELLTWICTASSFTEFTDS